jgi:uncharacterized OsmC-like protein
MTPTSVAPPAPTRDEALAAIVTATEGAVAGDPAAARVLFTAEGRSTGSVATRLRTRQHRFTVDEPASLGGDDAGANPVEHALAALISCQVVTYRFWAARLGIAVDEIRVEAAGDLDVRGFFGLDDAVRPGFTQIRLDVHLSGPESAERYVELRRTVDAHCPVLDLFTNASPVEIRLHPHQV